MVESPTSSRPSKIKALAIASSTGGPQALSDLLKSLRGKLDTIPVFITQHMPASFTPILAQNLSRVSGMDCHEAKNGEVVKPGVVYVAPGDYHMTIEYALKGNILRLSQEPPVNFCRPSADPMFYALAAVYKEKLLAVVLTGMGSDGLNGARSIVTVGGHVIVQDEETSVVWGMPKAIAEAKLATAIIPLPQMALYITRALA